MTLPGDAGGGSVLCRLADVPEGGAVGIEGGSPGEPGIVVVRRRDRVVAYRNVCPHASLPLDLVPGRVMSRDGRHLLCANHGALFEPGTGLCVAGPCKGKRLERVRAEVRRGEVLLRPGP